MPHCLGFCGKPATVQIVFEGSSLDTLTPIGTRHNACRDCADAATAPRAAHPNWATAWEFRRPSGWRIAGEPDPALDPR